MLQARSDRNYMVRPDSLILLFDQIPVSDMQVRILSLAGTLCIASGRKCEGIEWGCWRIENMVSIHRFIISSSEGFHDPPN